jgi:peptidoglycan/LPS O-acetylase OafA/YrhL
MTSAAAASADSTGAGGVVATSARLAALDGWRAISVGLVIFSHLTTASSLAIQPGGALGRLLGPFLEEAGFLGVHIFFVISGYVIVRGLIGEQARTGRISMAGFYIRRSFRILPPLALYVAAILALTALHVLPPVAFGTWQALTFTCNFADCGAWWGGHTWSLAYEEQFYLVTPVLFFATAARGRARAFLLFLAALCVIPVALAPFSERPSELTTPFIAIGMGVAWACTEGFVLRAAGRLPTLLVAPAIVLLVLAGRLEVTRLAPLAAIVAPMLIVYILARTCLVDAHVARWLSGRFLTFLGRISYGIYLWQQLATGRYDGAGPLFYVASVAACIAWAAASFVWIETPLINLGRSLSARLKRPDASAARQPAI